MVNEWLSRLPTDARRSLLIRLITIAPPIVSRAQADFPKPGSGFTQSVGICFGGQRRIVVGSSKPLQACRHGAGRPVQDCSDLGLALAGVNHFQQLFLVSFRPWFARGNRPDRFRFDGAVLLKGWPGFSKRSFSRISISRRDLETMAVGSSATPRGNKRSDAVANNYGTDNKGACH
jgi:hypothetical protein